jgi:hypothetical protein
MRTWKAALILSEVEGSGPNLRCGPIFHTLFRGGDGNERLLPTITPSLVIASAAKQSSLSSGMDCFVALLLAMTK